jgi:arginyl-tRNA synthetase
MNVFHFFKGVIIAVVQDLEHEGKLPGGLDLSRITVDCPKEKSQGHMATNAAMILAKPSGHSPRVLADMIGESLKRHGDVEKVETAGPGFINIFLKPEFWQYRLVDILKAGLSYGAGTQGSGQKINVEYLSTNPTGPMHTGHGRIAVLGDAIAALLQKVGYDVCREYYVNDAGGQIDALARSVYLRYREALGYVLRETDFEEGMYRADYLIATGKKLANLRGDIWLDQPETVWLEEIRQFSVEAMMAIIRLDLEALGIHMDVYTSEKNLVTQGRVEEALKVLKDKGDIYTGILEAPKGLIVDDWEPRSQTLFRATDYGDDVDRPLKKSDGSWTYFAGDIAYHLDKFRRGFEEMIVVLGADHAGYLKRIQAATLAVTNGKGSVEVKTCQLVNFMDDGIPLKMSKRAGTFIKLRDVIDQVGKDATRFMMLTRRNDMKIDFDFAKVTEKTRENPVFYVQYAHARACSVLERGTGMFPDALEFPENFITLLTSEPELEMIRLLASWPRQVEVAAQMREPHRIAYFLYDVAATFHMLWTAGKEQTQMRFIDPEDRAFTLARLCLVKAVTVVIASGMQLFGITPVEKM